MDPSPDAAILRALHAAAENSGNGFIPPSALGHPPEVSLRIAGLREAGYEIEQHPFHGYRLVFSPDRLIADDIVSRLPEREWIRDPLVFQKTTSTNDVIASLARDGAAEGAVVFAEEQTAGRGRLGRRWASDPSLGLWFSLLLRPAMPLALWPRITLWIAFAIAHGIEDYARAQPSTTPLAPLALKWPNDLHLSGRKLAGILVETSLGEQPFATAGIGLNINHPSFPPPLDSTATSLRIAIGSSLDRNGVAAAVLSSLDRSYPLASTGFPEVIAWANRVDCLRRRQVSATAGAVIHRGTAEGIDPGGALLLRTPEGELLPLSSGEVTHFSPEPPTERP